MSTSSARSTFVPTHVLTKYINCVSTSAPAHVASSTPNGTEPATDLSRPSSFATSGPRKSHTPLRFPASPALAMTCTIGPKAAAEMYGKAEAITPRRSDTAISPRTARSMLRLRRTSRCDGTSP